MPHLVVVLGGDNFVRRDAAGSVLLDTRAGGTPFAMPRYMWSDGLPAHTLENTGSQDLVTLSVELKRARGRPG